MAQARSVLLSVGLAALLAAGLGAADVATPVDFASAATPAGTIAAATWAHELVVAPGVHTQDSRLVPGDPVEISDEVAHTDWIGSWSAFAVPWASAMELQDESVLADRLYPATWMSRDQVRVPGPLGPGAAVTAVDVPGTYSVAGGRTALPPVIVDASADDFPQPAPRPFEQASLQLTPATTASVGFDTALGARAGQATAFVGQLWTGGAMLQTSGELARSTLVLPQPLSGTSITLLMASITDTQLDFSLDRDDAGETVTIVASVESAAQDWPVQQPAPGSPAATFTVVTLGGVLGDTALPSPGEVVAGLHAAVPAGTQIVVLDQSGVSSEWFTTGAGGITLTATGADLVLTGPVVARSEGLTLQYLISYQRAVVDLVSASVATEGRLALTEVTVKGVPVDVGLPVIGDVTINGVRRALDLATAAWIDQGPVPWSSARSDGLVSIVLTSQGPVDNAVYLADAEGATASVRSGAFAATTGLQGRAVWVFDDALVEARVYAAGNAVGLSVFLETVLVAETRIYSRTGLPMVASADTAITALHGEVQLNVGQDRLVPLLTEMTGADEIEGLASRVDGDSVWALIADSERALPDGPGAVGRYGGQEAWSVRVEGDDYTGMWLPGIPGILLTGNSRFEATVAAPIPTYYSATRAVAAQRP